MNEQHYAVVVGINRYPEFKDLHSARSDAEAFYAWLIDPNGGAVPDGNIELITVPDDGMPDGTPRREAKPVKKQIADALDAFRHRCKEHIEEQPADWYQTRLYFFASGHGIAPVPNEAALLMANAGPDYYGENFSCSKYLSFFLEGQFFKELVFLADCCRERVDNAPILGPTWTRVRNQNGEILTVRGFATYFGELAFEEEEDEETNPNEFRGYFTRALLEGLNGQAVNPDTREIDSISLADFVTERVQKLTAHRPKPQKPFIVPEPANPRIVFRSNVSIEETDKVLTQTVSIFFPDGFAGKVNLLDGTRNPIDTYEVGASPWIVSLVNGFYKVELDDGTSPFQDQGFFEVMAEDRDVNL